MNPIRVVNVRGMNRAEERAKVVYVGRACAGWKSHPLANPFKPINGDITGCLQKYNAWIFARPTIIEDLTSLLEATKDGELALGYWCFPNRCHASILKVLIEEFICPKKYGVH